MRALPATQDEAGHWERRQAVLRSLLYVDLQITAVQEHVAYLERRLIGLEQEQASRRDDGRKAA